MLYDFYYFTVLAKKSLNVLNIFLHIGVFHMLKHSILRGKGREANHLIIVYQEHLDCVVYYIALY